MSDIDDIRKYLETIGKDSTEKRTMVTETTLGIAEAGTYDSIEDAQAAAGSDLADIAMQIEELIEDARTIIYDSRDQMAMKRADGYWIAHILGALGLNEAEKTSMFTMMDTVKELNGEDMDESSGSEDPDSADMRNRLRGSEPEEYKGHDDVIMRYDDRGEVIPPRDPYAKLRGRR